MTRQPEPSSRPNTLDYASALRAKERSHLWRALVGLIIGIGLIGLAWFVAVKRAAPRQVPAPQPLIALQPATQPRVDVAAIYRGQIVPLLAQAEQRNRDAVARAIATLHGRFDWHRSGVQYFVSDVAGWGTRFGVIGRSIGDGWHYVWSGGQWRNSVHDYIDAKFRLYVLNEQAMQKDLDDTLSQLRDDLQASQNRLLSEVAVPLEQARAQVAIDAINVRKFQDDVRHRARELTSGMGGDSVVQGVAALAGGTVAQIAMQDLVVQIISRIGTAMAANAAVTAALEGTATAGGAAAGGGVGSAGGPAGTIIGFGVGLIAGAAVDWWMTDKFKARLTAQTTQFLDRVEQQFMQGATAGQGLETLFNQSVELTNKAQRQALKDCLSIEDSK